MSIIPAAGQTLFHTTTLRVWICSNEAFGQKRMPSLALASHSYTERL
jgi:hypothetical protein